MVNSNTMQWLDVVLPRCLICDSTAAAVFLDIEAKNNTNIHICFSCSDAISIMVEQRKKESQTYVYQKQLDRHKEGCNC